ncbi:MAG: cyclic nucleotide-binding domain-containing protein [Duncaniella sp.]|nr:cyclic nucleotide-binding domain-containing protein [Duncaniella sp.]
MSTPSAIFELIRALPLFNGISYSDLQSLVGEIPFEFEKFAPGEVIMEARESNTTLRFILSGRVRSIIRNASDRMRLSYILEGPSVIAPDFVFGRNTRVPMEAVADTAVSIVKLSKTDLVRLLQKSDIFLFNYLNIVSAYAQKGIDGVISLTGGQLEERIAFWLITLTPIDAREIFIDS